MDSSSSESNSEGFEIVDYDDDDWVLVGDAAVDGYGGIEDKVDGSDDGNYEDDDEYFLEEEEADGDGDGANSDGDHFDAGCHDMTLADGGPSFWLRLHVLPCLPAKDLLRLRAVCGEWARWISSPFFVLTHAVRPRPVSGLFYHSATGEPSFCPLAGAGDGIPDPALEFLFEPVKIMASASGLLLCRGRASGGYYVCNPATGAWAPLPPPAADHGPGPAAALVLDEPAAYNFAADYRVVVAYPISGDESDGVYGLETFSSATWRWAASSEIVAAEGIIAASGVAAAGKAYWRSTIGVVIEFDPANDACEMITWPESADRGTAGLWELGEAEGRLVATCVGSRGWVTAYEGDGAGWWRSAARFRIPGIEVGGDSPSPLRGQGSREVLTWEPESRQVVARDFAGATLRTSGGGAPGYCADFLPYVSSLLPVKAGP